MNTLSTESIEKLHELLTKGRDSTQNASKLEKILANMLTHLPLINKPISLFDSLLRSKNIITQLENSALNFIVNTTIVIAVIIIAFMLLGVYMLRHATKIINKSNYIIPDEDIVTKIIKTGPQEIGINEIVKNMLGHYINEHQLQSLKQNHNSAGSVNLNLTGKLLGSNRVINSANNLVMYPIYYGIKIIVAIIDFIF